MNLSAEVGSPSKGEDFFDRLLEIICPYGRGLVVMLEAYFDESERTGGTFAVAGYAFAPQQARKFTKEWRELFADRIAHMTDLVARQRAFKGITNTERDRLVREAVKIINRRITFGVSISVNMAELNALTPEWIQGFGHAYPICCHLAMSGLGMAIVKKSLQDDVAYVFEAGHDHEGEARRFMLNVATNNGPLKEYYRYRSDSFLSKADAVPLQAADMLAWEWTKCQDETREQRKRPIRRSLLALFQSEPSRYTVHHMTGAPLAKYLNTVRGLGLAQLREDEIRSKFPHLLPD